MKIVAVIVLASLAVAASGFSTATPIRVGALAENEKNVDKADAERAEGGRVDKSLKNVRTDPLCEPTEGDYAAVTYNDKEEVWVQQVNI
jgi:hypothetical protein